MLLFSSLTLLLAGVVPVAATPLVPLAPLAVIALPVFLLL